MSNLPVDWIALGVSVIALLASGAALWQASRFRRGDKAVELARLSSKIGERLAALATSVPDIKSGWAALLAANGNYHSGARIQIENELDQHLADIGQLRTQLGALSGDPAKMGNSALERRAVELWSLKLAMDRVGSGIDGQAAKLAEGLASRRRMMESRKPS